MVRRWCRTESTLRLRTLSKAHSPPTHTFGPVTARRREPPFEHTRPLGAPFASSVEFQLHLIVCLLDGSNFLLTPLVQQYHTIQHTCTLELDDARSKRGLRWLARPPSSCILPIETLRGYARTRGEQERCKRCHSSATHPSSDNSKLTPNKAVLLGKRFVGLGERMVNFFLCVSMPVLWGGGKDESTHASRISCQHQHGRPGCNPKGLPRLSSEDKKHVHV